jgi:hypothetical protein
VRYLDCLDFGLVMLPPTLPRIRVWKGDLIKHFSNMDIGLTGKYGAHAVSVLFFLSMCSTMSNFFFRLK